MNIRKNEIVTLRKKMDITKDRSTLNHYGHSLQDLGQKAGYFNPIGKLLFAAADTLLVYTKPEYDDELMATGITRAKHDLEKAIAQIEEDIRV